MLAACGIQEELGGLHWSEYFFRVLCVIDSTGLTTAIFETFEAVKGRVQADLRRLHWPESVYLATLGGVHILIEKGSYYTIEIRGNVSIFSTGVQVEFHDDPKTQQLSLLRLSKAWLEQNRQ